MSVAALPCATCGEAVPAGDAFCEACGAPMATLAPAVAAPPAPTACATCGAAADQVDGDGYCTSCGTRRRRGERDHLTAALDGVAAVTDRGRRHHRNEDAFAVARHDGRGLLAVVVCDGVSSSTLADEAAQAAADAACRRLAAVPAGADHAARSAAVVEAVRDAQAAVLAVGRGGSGHLSAPSCTFVGALVDREGATVGWVGDSRAYWLATGARPERLTTDHSWASEQLASGRPEAEVMADPDAHAITRWLGADQSGDPQVDTRTLRFRGAGRLLVCSDGLWNVATDDEIAALAAGADLAAAAEALVALANGRGGPDNITVVLCEVRPLAPPTPEGSTPSALPAPRPEEHA